MSNALETDFYQLTMVAGYWRAGLLAPATFDLFVRRLPPERSYLLAAGLEDALAFLETLQFDDAARAWLATVPAFADVPRAFFDEYLASFRFAGDVWAMPEGTLLFPGEPILRVTAPLPQAQLVETALLSIVGFQTAVASKARRVVDAAAGRTVVEFGARRAHGLGAAIAAARAAYLGGCGATSCVEAARRYGIPPSGTMAHAWVQAFPEELQAFREFSRTYHEAVYLLDTYDTLAAARAVVSSELHPAAVRLDSGDLDALSRAVRRILDDGGRSSTRIFVSGDLDEHRVARLVADDAPIDAFGVGGALTTVADAPVLACVYKLVALERGGTISDVVKLSEGKSTLPGVKQVWRREQDGRIAGDLVAGVDEPQPPRAHPLLACVMRNGKRTNPAEPIAAIRARVEEQMALLPESVRRLEDPEPYPVRVSHALAGRRAALANAL
ncbi:MAG: nicotinate phosphoribosyltransferase [Betaproteobacteria bacterium]